jgi:hypothetical protein
MIVRSRWLDFYQLAAHCIAIAQFAQFQAAIPPFFRPEPCRAAVKFVARGLRRAPFHE